MDERQMVTIGIMIAFLSLFLILVNVLDNTSINGIKAKQVGDGQHGTARWATKQEILLFFLCHSPFRVEARKEPAKPRRNCGSLPRNNEYDSTD